MHLIAAVIASAVVLVIGTIAVLTAHIGTSDTEDLEWEVYRCEFE
jgi:hypothetical protein